MEMYLVLETPLYLSSDQNYSIKIKVEALLVQIETCKKMLNGFKNE